MSSYSGESARHNLGWLPKKFLQTLRRLSVQPGRFVFCVNLRSQSARLLGFDVGNQCTNRGYSCPCNLPSTELQFTRPHDFRLIRTYRCSTSRFGIGQKAGSNCTPLGLHRIARKVGGGWPVGTAFKSRLPVGFTWQDKPFAPISTRILWLEGLEPGFNRGGDVDTFRRYIYIHGTGDEPTLGKPASHGCIHLAACDLVPLYEKLPVGTLVWIER